MNQQFADVILPLPVEGKFTYLLTTGLISDDFIGRRVIVPFGKKKYYTGIISSVHSSAPENMEIKEILSVIDDKPLVFPENIKLWEWVGEYYCCSVGEVMNAALPSGLKPESSTKVTVINDPDFALLNQNEIELLGRISSASTSVSSLLKGLPPRILFHTLNSLIEKKYLSIEEKIGSGYKQKSETMVSFSSEIKNESILNAKISGLRKAKKQEGLLLHFCNLSGVFSSGETKEISRKKLLKGTLFTPASLKELIKKGILSEQTKVVSRLENNPARQGELNLLNPFQEEALAEIKSFFEKGKVVLLHGVTSSGKTEIYMHLMKEAISRGQQVLYLVPEIALTAQLVSRLKRVFGNKSGVYHSKLSDAERVEIWEKVRNFSPSGHDSYQIILGARSSVLLPFKNLGLIVVDEEHENSYKQYDPAPRYNARDLAVVFGSLGSFNVLLGSATPSFESYFNAKSGKFGLVELNVRHGDLELPEIVVSDLQRAYKRKQMKSFLGPELYAKINESLNNHEQVILFQNRRGYAPFVQCANCGWIPKCEHCDVSLAYHKFKKQLTCHYCGYFTGLPEKCPKCGSPEVKTRGLGTEKIEDELRTLFPSARIARMDLDSTRRKNAIEKLVRKLENRETDILVGTQMVTKGLDFEHVQTVGILNADNQINFPDFRAHERSYQLFSQVSGRAGRKFRKGSVVIQTTQPDHPVINEIRDNAYQKTFERQLAERKLFKYPPFYRLIKIIVKHKNEGQVHKVASGLAALLRENPQLLVLGPEAPLVGRVKLWYQKEIWIKLNRDNRLGEHKKLIIQCVRNASHLPNNSGAVYTVDVDPA